MPCVDFFVSVITFKYLMEKKSIQITNVRAIKASLNPILANITEHTPSEKLIKYRYKTACL